MQCLVQCWLSERAQQMLAIIIISIFVHSVYHNRLSTCYVVIHTYAIVCGHFPPTLCSNNIGKSILLRLKRGWGGIRFKAHAFSTFPHHSLKEIYIHSVTKSSGGIHRGKHTGHIFCFLAPGWYVTDKLLKCALPTLDNHCSLIIPHLNT